MTYGPHWLFAWGGLSGASGGVGVEIWSNSIRLMPGLSGTFGAITNPDGAMDDLEADLRTLFTSTASGYSSNQTCTWLKLNEIGPDGKYVDQENTNVHTFPEDGPVFGGNSAAIVPLNVAAAVTFRTARSRGRASRGRIYIPQPAIPLEAQKMRFTTAGCVATATVWAQFIANLGNWPGLDLPNSPMAGVVSGLGEPGPQEEITRVEVGNVPDTQRRRRNALDEVYSGVVVP